MAATAEAPTLPGLEFEEGYQSFDTESLSLNVNESGVYRFRQWDQWDVLDKRTGDSTSVPMLILQEFGKEIYYHAGGYDLVRGFKALDIPVGTVVKITRLADKDVDAPAAMKCYKIQPAKSL